MRDRIYLCLGLPSMLALPAAANAECQPVFVDASTSLTLSASSDLDAPQPAERFKVRIRNQGDSACDLRLAVGREAGVLGSDSPVIALTGPTGDIRLGSVTAAIDSVTGLAQVKIPAGGEIAVPYEIRMNVGWGSAAGTYVENLLFELVSTTGERQSSTQRTQLLLQVPSAVRIRFAGALGENNEPRLDMGELSPDKPSRSPPFAIRVLSTAGYQMRFESVNSGNLQRNGGTERIPYQMSVGGRPMDLSLGSGLISVGHHTGLAGDIHPVAVLIAPDPLRHAGSYSDRITVTVTAI